MPSEVSLLLSQVFATASTDTSIQLWDVRKLGAGLRPLACANHTHGCQAALFAPDGAPHTPISLPSVCCLV
jgi:WD40 repeat protein